MPELVGTWQTMPEPGSPPDELIVVNFNDTEYYVELREHAEGWSEGDTLRLRAYITHVNGQAFINAQYIGSMKPDDRVFFFNTVTLNPDGTLTLTELNELDEMGPDDFETSEALYAFIRRNLHNQDLYGASITLRRISG